MSAEELQNLLNSATDGFPEIQIDHVVGTKIILGFESWLNAKDRDARASELVQEISKGLSKEANKNACSLGY